MLIGNARAKRQPTQVVEINGRRGHGCYRGDIRCPHPGISVKTTLVTDCGGRKERDRQNRRGNAHRDFRNDELGSVFRLARFPTDVRGPCVGQRLCGKHLTCPYPTPHLERGADAGARIRRVYRMSKQRTRPRTGQKNDSTSSPTESMKVTSIRSTTSLIPSRQRVMSVRVFSASSPVKSAFRLEAQTVHGVVYLDA
jgi:hypothetical protein